MSFAPRSCQDTLPAKRSWTHSPQGSQHIPGRQHTLAQDALLFVIAGLQTNQRFKSDKVYPKPLACRFSSDKQIMLHSASQQLPKSLVASSLLLRPLVSTPAGAKLSLGKDLLMGFPLLGQLQTVLIKERQEPGPRADPPIAPFKWSPSGRSNGKIL